MSSPHALASQEDAWRNAVRLGTFGVWDLRPEQEAVHYSPRWKERLGFPRPGGTDHAAFWRCRVHPDDLDVMLRALHDHLEGRSAIYEMRFRLRSNGSGYRAVLSRGRAVARCTEGKALRVVGTMVDLTQRPVSPPPTAWSTDEDRWDVPLMDSPFHTLLDGGADRQIVGQVADLLDLALSESRLLA